MSGTGVRPVRRALLAVSDKTGLADLGRELTSLGVALVSSGGTAAALRDAGVKVTPVSEVTGSPEMLGGRVKTLHPKIHGGILADRSEPEHLSQLEEHAIEPFDLVVVNLYPFRETVASDAPDGEVVENIDIGGPAMVRAAAKNHASVAVVVSPSRYAGLLEELGREGGVSLETRRALAAEAYAHTAAYDAAIASWFAERESGPCAWDRRVVVPEGMPAFVGLALDKRGDLRYGENPHQRAALYGEAGGPGPLGGAEVLQGKEMSYNNWLDAESAYGLIADLTEPSCVIVKHNNPCGAARGATLGEAYRRAFESDTVSAFGGIVAFSGEVDADAAGAMAEVFTEVVIAPAFADEARAAYAGRENLRVVRAPLPSTRGVEVRPIRGGALVQTRDDLVDQRGDAAVVSRREPSEQEWRDLLFASAVAARVKSNSIVFVHEEATVGIGAGQMSRVDSALIAVRKAAERAKGAAMASDAFFPFSDALEVAADAGVTAVIHPGGSLRDAEVLAEADRRGMAVAVTGRRHFRH